MDIYETCPTYQSELITIRLLKKEDANELLATYSDNHSVPNFNSDNCNGDTFYYDTLIKMEKAVDFWLYSYQNKYFVRFTIIDNKSNKIIGTIEMFDHSYSNHIGEFGVLRIDIMSDYENGLYLNEILALVNTHFYNDFKVDTIITKAVNEAKIRVNVLLDSGYKPLTIPIVPYNNYYFKCK